MHKELFWSQGTLWRSAPGACNQELASFRVTHNSPQNSARVSIYGIGSAACAS